MNIPTLSFAIPWAEYHYLVASGRWSIPSEWVVKLHVNYKYEKQT
jgi:hypothetical protein